MKRFNILDLFVVLFAVALVAFLCVRFTSSSNAVEGDGAVTTTYVAETQDVVYTVVVKNIRDFTAQAIPSSGEVVNETGLALGEITGKKITPAKIFLQTKDGSYDEVERVDRYDVELTLKGEGAQQISGFYIGGQRCYVVGSGIYIDAGNVPFQGEITKMEVIYR